MGDGNDIKNWGDKWIPAPTSCSIQSPRKILEEGAKVVKLIDQDTKWWIINLIKEVFREEEARVICQIPLSPGRQKNLFIWRGTSNGEFSIRSAYHLEEDFQSRRSGGGSRQEEGGGVWKVIWGLKIPNAVEMLMWRACNNLLPTKENLFRRGST